MVFKRKKSNVNGQMLNVGRGFSVVEIILSGAVFLMLVTAFVGAYLYGQESTALAGNQARATMLAEEGLEAVRNIRDPAFSNLTDGTYGLTTTGNQWNLSGSSDTTGIFARQMIISTVDSKRKLVTANVTWQQNTQRTGLVSLVTRITNWIASGSNWVLPIQEASIDVTGTNNGIKVQVSGNYAYMVRDGGTNFLVVDVSTPASASVVGSLTLTGVPTNIAVSGNYAYVSNTDNSQELQIIDISNPLSPILMGSYNAPGSANATGVFAIGTTVYLVRASSSDDEFSIIDASVASKPFILGSLDLGANANEVVVSGNYAYVASASNTQELQVVSIATPSAPTLAGSFNLAGTVDAFTVAISGNTVFLGQGAIFYTINVASPTSPASLGSVSTTSTINDIALNLGGAGTYVFIATSDNSLEFQVVDVATLATPTILGSVNTAGTDNLNGVAYDVTLDRAFGVGDRDTEEFFVFAPQ